MPIFEYKCNDCGNEFEELVFDRDECPPCPKCASDKTDKLMSAVRSRVGGGAPDMGGDSEPAAAPAAAPSPCAGCSGGDCSSCG
jgi:putative FmdB family regulatory protein